MTIGQHELNLEIFQNFKWGGGGGGGGGGGSEEEGALLNNHFLFVRFSNVNHFIVQMQNANTVLI